MEQILQQHWATTHVSDLLPPLSSPLTTAQTTEVLSKTLSFLQLYRLPRPFFQSQQNQQRWDLLAADAQRRLEGMKRDHESQQRGMLIRERDSLRRHVLGDDDMRRPITQLFRNEPNGEPSDSGFEVFRMVAYVYGKMIHASKGVEHASALVFVGHREWDRLNRWERINVALAAKEYFEEKRGVAQFLHGVGLLPIASSSVAPLQSLGHHVPSFTGRQSRRSGILEMELRAKWGDGGEP